MPLSSHPQIPHNVSAIRAGLTSNVDKMALTQAANSSMTMADDSQNTRPSQPTDLRKPSLPPPQSFDILPALHELLARIDNAPTNTAGDNPLQPDTSMADSEDGGDIGAHYQDQQPLDPKDLPTEVLAIKAKIRKALREVEKLPDVEWSVEEQEEETAELEARIERQRAMLKRFGELGKGVGLG